MFFHLNGKGDRSCPAGNLPGRVTVYLALFYITGLITGRFVFTKAPPANWLLPVFIIIFLFAIFKSGLFRPVFQLILAMVLAAGIILYIAEEGSQNRALTEFNGKLLIVEGVVFDEPRVLADRTEYRLAEIEIRSNESRFALKDKLLLVVYSENAPGYSFGEKLRVRGEIRQPRGLRNPGGFDYQYYLREQGIEGIIYANPHQVRSDGRSEQDNYTAVVLGLRKRMVESIEVSLPGQTGSLLVALLFGIKDKLSDEVALNFSNAGAGHLMAVSGLHVGLVAALILGFFKRINLRGRMPLLLALFAVLFYAFLTGMRPSAFRASIMAALSMAALIFDRDYDLPTALSFAALFNLLLNPLVLFTPGFQFSYAATLSLVYGYKPLLNLFYKILPNNFISSLLAVSFAAQMGVIPLNMYYFHTLPLSGFVVNILLILLVPFAVGFGLAGILIMSLLPAAGEILYWSARPVLELMLGITALGGAPNFVLSVNPPGLIGLIFFYGLTIAVLAYYYYLTDEHSRKRLLPDGIADLFNILSRTRLPGELTKPKIAALVLLFMFLMNILWSPFQEEELTVTFIDVGQGAAVLIEDPCGGAVMVDAGGEGGQSSDPSITGERTILPLLRYKGINEIDLAFVTHPHEDHFGGYRPLVNEGYISRMVTINLEGDSPFYQMLLDDAAKNNITITQANRGMSWSCSCGLELKVLSPPDGNVRGSGSIENDNSLVILVKYGEFKILLTGDLEDAGIEALLDSGLALEADVLQIPHHGGFTEKIADLLEAVKPSMAVIQVGVNNFGHPNAEVLQLLNDKGIEIFRNDLHGAVIVRSSGQDYSLVTMEDRRAMFIEKMKE